MIDNQGSKGLNYFLTLLLISAILISTFGFYRDFRNTVGYGGIDLRPKVTGSRLLMNSIDPYHYKWEPGDPEIYLDPMDSPDVPVSRVTVSPAYLVLHSTIAYLPYRIQRNLWLFVQWALFLASLALFAKASRSGYKSKIIWAAGLLFIGGSSFWRLHAERGQIYVIFTFLLALSYFISRKSFKHSHLLSGFLIGYTITLRPPAALIGIPILIYRQWKMALGAIIGGLFGFLSPLIYTGVTVWERYYSSMRYFGSRPDALGIPWGEPYKFLYPEMTVEGFNIANLAMGAELEAYDLSIQAIFVAQLGRVLSPNTLSIAMAIVVVMISIFLLRFRIKAISCSMLFLVSITLFMLGELFLPAAKYPYTNIIWVIPLSLILIMREPVSSLLKPHLIFLFIGMFINIAMPFAPGGLLPGSLLVLTYIIIETGLLYKERYNHQVVR